MTVESYTVASPSMSTGTLPCGLTAKNSGGLGPQRVWRVQGICNVSYSRPFSARAIRTLVLKGLRTPDHSFMDDLLSASQVRHAACQCGLPLSGSQSSPPTLLARHVLLPVYHSGGLAADLRARTKRPTVVAIDPGTWAQVTRNQRTRRSGWAMTSP